MLLANSSVSGKAATGHVLMYAPTGGFPRILALHPKSLRQIGNLWFFKTNSEIVGIALLRSNGRKGSTPLQWLAALPSPSMEAALPPALALHPKWIRWLGCAGRARGAPAAEGASPLAIGKANAPAPEVSAYGVLYISE